METGQTFVEVNETNDKNMLSKIKKAFKKEAPEFTAEYAWIETTYGDGSYHSLEERIKDKQTYIKNLIKSKFPARGDGTRFSNSNGSYRCVVDIEEDLTSHIKEIFEPFINGGFKVINISEQVKEIDDENVYLVSWKNIFKQNDCKS